MSHDGRSLAAIESLQHMLDDADVRRNLARGAGAVQRASGLLSGDGKRQSKTSRRKGVQQLREAVTSFGRVGAAAREAELKRQRSRRRRRRFVTVLAVSGAGAATSLAVRGRTRGGDDTDSPPAAAATPAPATAE
jgi:hypothetical protein